MKNVFFSMGIALCAILSIVIVMTLCGINMRQNELNDAVNNAMKETVENQFNDKTYSVSSDDEFVADFMESLLVQINSDCAVTIQVLDVDYAKGLLSVEVTETFQHPIGTQGKVSVKRTVIMEQYQVPAAS